MHTENRVVHPDSDVAIAGRWAHWVRITVAVQVLSFLIYSLFICGCHFNAFVVPVGVVPVVWGFYTYFCYRTWCERIVGFINGALSISWLYFTWDMNIQFAFR